MIKKHIYTRYLENGIEFRSHKCPDVFYGTTYDEDNEIWHNFSFWPIEEMLHRKNFNCINLRVIIIDILFIALSIMAENPVMIIGSILFSIFISFKLDKLSRKKFSQASKFHAAKHKVFNAWSALNYERIPTLDEARKASHFSKECRDNSLLRNCLYYLILLIITVCTIDNNILFILLTMLTIAIFILAIRFDLIQYLQVLSINKPTDRELTLVLEALDDYLRVESSINISVFEDTEVVEFMVGESDEENDEMDVEESDNGPNKVHTFESLSVEDVIVEDEGE